MVIEPKSLQPLLSLTARQTKGKSLYVVGDIHGCFEELLELEEKIYAHAKKRKETPLIICVGDYCDRGPMSNQVIEHVLRGSEVGTHLGVLGNHEWYFLLVNATPRLSELETAGIKWPPYLLSCAEMLKEMDSTKKNSDRELRKMIENVRDRWSTNGGETTMASYGTKLRASNVSDSVPLEHLGFLMSCPIAIKTPFGIVTHAHMHREHFKVLKMAAMEKGPELADLQHAVDRCLWNRVLPKEPVLNKLWHFSGHTPLEKVKKSGKNRWIQLDTGCVYGNTLTAVHMKTRKNLSVKSRQGEGC